MFSQGCRTEGNTETIHSTGTKVLKCSEGLYNKAFILTMDNGLEVVAKLPNPNAGPAQYTTASEVATHALVRSTLSLINT